MPEGDSFLPRIQSVFYAVFDVKQGAQIVYQVPEDLIAVPPPGPFSSVNGAGSLPPTPSTETPPHIPVTPTGAATNLLARKSNSSLVSPTNLRHGRLGASSPQKRSASAQRFLFNFSDISKYIIPPSPLCGRLVTCSTPRHHIMGFPVAILGKYDRVYFRYNLCFVFDREADLSCYEPIVRKVGCVLKACEEESEFLSSPTKSIAVHAILEQLYEDLNSYSETSIQIDRFNSIELKIFPFYPNPPAVKDWMVPLALINLSKRMEDNWDVTMLKVCKHVDGVNHVSRIAHLADCDLSLARQAISHLLYYQVIMVIDIFQYSNMYTLRKNIQWLADEAHVKEECGPYVTKPGRNIPDWPKLLHLYSRLKPGKTVFEWTRAYDVESMGIDVRRFTSFGVVKGFLRRVHRYPVYLPPDPSQPVIHHIPNTNPITYDPMASSGLAQRRGKNLANTNLRLSGFSTSSQSEQSQTGVAFPGPSLESIPHGLLDSPLPSVTPMMSATHRARRASAAEKVLEQLRSRDIQKSGPAALASPRTSWLSFQQHEPMPISATTTTTVVSPTASTSLSTVSASVSSTITVMPATATHGSPTKAPPGRSEGRRLSLTTPSVPPPSPVFSKLTVTPARATRASRSPSVGQTNQPLIVGQTSSQPAIPPELIPLLDGDHHTDELSVRFEVGWPLLEQWLTSIGAGEGEGDYGRVAIIYQ